VRKRSKHLRGRRTVRRGRDHGVPAAVRSLKRPLASPGIMPHLTQREPSRRTPVSSFFSTRPPSSRAERPDPATGPTPRGRSHRLSDQAFHANRRALRPRRDSPVPAVTVHTFRTLLRRGVFTAAPPGSSPLPWPSRESPGSALPQCLTAHRTSGPQRCPEQRQTI